MLNQFWQRGSKLQFLVVFSVTLVWGQGQSWGTGACREESVSAAPGGQHCRVPAPCVRGHLDLSLMFLLMWWCREMFVLRQVLKDQCVSGDWQILCLPLGKGRPRGGQEWGSFPKMALFPRGPADELTPLHVHWGSLFCPRAVPFSGSCTLLPLSCCSVFVIDHIFVWW